MGKNVNNMNGIELREEILRLKKREDNLKCELFKLNPKHEFTGTEVEKVKIDTRNRDNNQCCFCRRNIYEVSTDKTLHHKIPRRYGGSEKSDNLITICTECHELLEELIDVVEEKAKEFVLVGEGERW